MLKKESLIYKYIDTPDPKDKFTCREKLGIGDSISIITLSQCNLHCSFCRGGMDQTLLKEYSRFSVMNLDEFKKIVNKCSEHGIKYYDLTPAIGEPFIDKTILEKLNHLQNDESVSEFTMTTNLLLVEPEDVIRMTKFDKLILDVSIYGETVDQYRSSTNRDKFDEFIKKLEMLYDNCSSMRIRFIQRCQLTQKSIIDSYLKAFANNRNVNLVKTELYNLNRGGNIVAENSSPRKRCGVCPNGPGSGGGIVKGGNVLFCPFHDVARTGVVGNVFDNDLKSIYDGEDFKKIIDSHKNNDYVGICENCDETW